MTTLSGHVQLAETSVSAFFLAKSHEIGHAIPMTKTIPDYSFEQAAHGRGFCRVAGVDEVGRGPLAGPVTAAAVILDPDHIPDGLNDSKKLTAKKREALFAEILNLADVSIAHATVEEIDELNILYASHLAMERAVAGLSTPADHLLIDGNMAPKGLTIPNETLVKGDSRSVSIAAASIVAKVTRDRIMVDLAQQFPGYGWETNAGYPSKIHKEGLSKLGITPHHRRSFKPIHNILYQQKNVMG
ncbi:Ribonuclease HII [Aliiroseovarius sp. xm-m-379]|nr:Ribonuclease HII [Aliiroseovarius sp. xm-m-379]NRP30427.1 Ribonuclease HII [Aliiroseovarius sp. xm-m-314]NRP34859.1 Ribonuclease HII [Aliiroseovarius sp. xm-a-104]NRP42861.1 Ribonuclease HII [Aliiroseovarius sp. xm-m-378]NRP49985.1 Ribonuclease HII [Aliiroseovarius sp. xm-m-354]NRP63732.1 Ribonuclease HII [Aliiroseovarius sp. xm-v-225]NRP80069.1 Ribonuclease HII [Aliiroseovarius sp. xm-v-209]NRP90793.1 Ribonuclease HII [Aliiroseovarius sp. xm-a-134]NRQ04739.1 Ribonuclease HII [Aliiroseov